MALRLEDKKQIVDEVAEVAKLALSAVVADYRGLTVHEMTQLRKQARNSDIHVQVVRNTLARLAVKDTEFECLADAFTGPTILAFSKNEPGAAARLMSDFKKDHELLEVKALAIAGKLLAASDLDTVAKLPTKDEAIASLLRVMKAPVTQLVRTVAEPTAQLVRVLAQVRDQKQQAS